MIWGYELKIFLSLPLVLALAFLIYRIFHTNPKLLHVLLLAMLALALIFVWKLGELLLFLSLLN